MTLEDLEFTDVVMVGELALLRIDEESITLTRRENRASHFTPQLATLAADKVRAMGLPAVVLRRSVDYSPVTE